MRIIYIGLLYKGGTCRQRLRAMQDLGHELIPMDTGPELVRKKQARFSHRLRRKILGPSDLAGVNQRLLQLINEDDYDLIWLDKGLTVRAETLRIIRRTRPEIIIAGYSTDDLLNPENQSRHFLKGLSYYDIFFTTKSFGVKEIKGLGCQRVDFFNNAYDPHTHKPIKMNRQDRMKFGGAVGFIGAYEKERAESIRYLADCGVPVRVWGPGWDKSGPHSNIRIEGASVLHIDYAKAICSFDINLCFLRRINRDLQTTRSIEIPACGGFMLAERTQEHLALFEENKEAAYFSSNEELLKRVRYFLENEEKRKEISISGRERCLNSGYSYQEKMKSMFNLIQQIN